MDRRTSSLPAVAVLGLLLASSISAALAGPQSTPRAMTPADVARLRAVTSVALSPDGETVAFTLSVPRRPGEDEDGPAWTELHVVDYSGGEVRPFATGDVRISQVRWVPDGQSISYVAKRGDDKASGLYVIPLHGGESRLVVQHADDVQSYSWRPDGKAVAFVAKEPESKEQKEAQKKGFSQEIYEEDWRAQKVYLAAVSPPGEEPKEARPLDLPGQAWHAQWNPAGTHLVVDLSPTPLVDDQYMSRRLHVVDAQTGAVDWSIPNPGKLGAFEFTPAGDAVVLVSAQDLNDPQEGRLLRAQPGGELEDLLPDLQGHVEDFEFGADGALVYLASVGVGTRVARFAANGDHQVLYDGTSPVLSGLSADAAGKRLALMGQSATHPPEVVTLDPAGEAPVRRTHHNEWLREIAFAPQEVLPYYAVDDLLIEAVLIEPLERAPGERVPLIVVAHGGPESHFSNGWLTGYSLPGQMAAARGYAVFYPNYRGSTGRGVEFSKADQGDPGGAEFDDVLDGVDHLVASGLVDPARVGITGGSYGGYFTAWGSTRHSDRFAAGVMFVGISDLLSKSGTTDIPNEMHLVHWLTSPYENLQLFLERSPVLYASQAQTPLLILHGKDDPRVNVGQSRELYRALKMKGDVPVRLVLYPGEGHGNRRAGSRYDYSLRMLRWFDHFLKEGGTDLPPADLDYGLEEPQTES